MNGTLTLESVRARARSFESVDGDTVISPQRMPIPAVRRPTLKAITP